MKLEWFQVREFQSVKDSGVIKVDDIACLVGKNEAGKSALLMALYRLHPIVSTDGTFSVTHDYPRMDVEDYRFAIEEKERVSAVPIQACYSLARYFAESIKKLHADKSNSIADICNTLRISKTTLYRSLKRGVVRSQFDFVSIVYLL